MTYNPNIHNRKSIRIKDYDYSQKGIYSITMCIQNRENLLGMIEDNKIILSKIGNIVEEELKKISQKYLNTSIKIYTIMPNHIHFIIEFKSKGENSLGDIIKYYKSKTIIKIRNKIWQRNYYEHIIRNDADYYEKYEYIINNPYKWIEDNLYKK